MDSWSRRAAIAVWMLGCGRVFAQTTEWISRNASGGISDNWSVNPAITRDSRFVAFASYATDIVFGDTNGGWDVFVRDRLTGTTERVSVDSNGVEGDDWSGDFPQSIAISADGRFVAFGSRATNLVSGDTSSNYDTFVRDRLTGTTERVSVDSAGGEQDGLSAYGVAISEDGRYVAFISNATNLVAGDTNGVLDVFVRDRQAGTTERVSVDSAGGEANGASDFGGTLGFSADGRFVVFSSSASNLVPGDTNGVQDVFVKDRQTGTTERVSVASGGAEGDLSSRLPAISADGRFVAFMSDATDFVAGDTNGLPDVFVHDRQSGATTLVGLNSSGIPATWGSDGPVGLSADGRYVLFMSGSPNLFPGNPYQFGHVFRHDRETGITTQADIGSFGSNPDGGGYTGAITDDGQHIAFMSHATNLVQGDTDFGRDVYVHDFLPANVASFCLGDGSGTACPCANTGRAQRGCETSTATGGAILVASGTTSLAGDTLQFACHGERAQALTVILQGTANSIPVNYGDGLLCVAGSLKRLYVKGAQLGIVIAPFGSEPSVSARSAALGDTIGSGETRYYQAYFRDPTATFCPDPPGNTWNVSNALSAVWDP
ncbi:MAG TPA: calcium-binding protein [Planctomycetota bacterium]|nr:calcium-binding protein [Planctomycetota bacterium]